MITVYLVLYEMENNEGDNWYGVEGVYATEELAESAAKDAKTEPEAPNVTYVEYWTDPYEVVGS